MSTFFAYLDGFGRMGPYVSRNHPRYNESLVFGLAGFVMPAAEVHGFGTWVFQRKQEVFSDDITRSGKIPAKWEKKGSSFFSRTSVTRYRQVRLLANRLLSKITSVNGFVFYVGVKKILPHELDLYQRVFVEALKRIDQFCSEDCNPSGRCVVVLDQHSLRSKIVTVAGQAMFGGHAPKRHLIEPPFQVESHRYQTLQAADWIAGLMGRLGAYCADPVAYKDYGVFIRYFGQRVCDHSRRCGIQGLDSLSYTVAKLK